MKSPEEGLAQVVARLGKTWSQVVAGAPWVPEFRLGTSGLTGRRLAEGWPEIHRTAMRWNTWIATAGDGIHLVHRPATVHGTPQMLPAMLVVPTIDDAARLAGVAWEVRLSRARQRLEAIGAQFPGLEDPAGMLRAIDHFSDVDVELALRSAAWFAAHRGHGLTARQVPVAGMGTKWLASRLAVVQRLAGAEDLGLERGRPPRVHLTYLDPGHLASGRRHDVATTGDVDALAYRPRVVIISENRDTAQLFPSVPGGIAIEGEGRGAGAIAALPWVRAAAPDLWYWGDMDADGLEILHSFRAAGLPVRSLFMDLGSYERWERYGVDHDHAGRPIGPRAPRDTGALEAGERDLYAALCSPGWTRHRRIEQERIPLAEAAAAVLGR